jgi:hypothetical protein
MSPSTADRLWQRLGAAGGILYVALALTGNTVGFVEPPAPNASRDAVAAFWAATSATWPLRVSLMLLAFFCFVFFVGSLWDVLRRAEGESSQFAAVALGGGLLTAAVQLGEFPPTYAGIQWANSGLDPNIARMLALDLNGAGFLLSWFTLAILLSATAVVVIRTWALPQWIGWVATVLAVALLVSVWAAVAISFEFPLPFILTLLWIITVSVVLIWRAGKPLPVIRSSSASSPPAAS